MNGQGKYSAVIGFKDPITREHILGTYKKTRFSTNHSAAFPLVHQTTEFRQTTVRSATLPDRGKSHFDPRAHQSAISFVDFYHLDHPETKDQLFPFVDFYHLDPPETKDQLFPFVDFYHLDPPFTKDQLIGLR